MSEIAAAKKLFLEKLVQDSTLILIMDQRWFGSKSAPSKDPSTNLPVTYPFGLVTHITDTDLYGMGRRLIWNRPVFFVRGFGENSGEALVDAIVGRATSVLTDIHGEAVEFNNKQYSIDDVHRIRLYEDTEEADGMSYYMSGAYFQCLVSVIE